MTLAEKLRRVLYEKKWPAAHLANRLGVSPATISRILSGGQTASNLAYEIATTLNVSSDWLLDEVAEWPPPPSGAASLGDFELVEELSRRRRLVIQDMKVLAAKFADPDKMRRLEAVAEESFRSGFAKMDFKKQEWLKTAYFDLERIRLLEHRLAMMGLGDRSTAENQPSLAGVLSDFPRLRQQLSTIPASSDKAVMSDHPTGGIVPVFDAVGAVVDRTAYIALGPILQRSFVPVIEDIENGPPAEKPILIYEGQQPPTRFDQFVRCDVDQEQAFALHIRDNAAAPDYPKGAVVVCVPEEPDRGGQTPAVAVYDRGRKTGIFLVSGGRLVATDGKTLKLRSGDKPAVYPIVAGPFPPAKNGATRASKRGKKE